MPPLKPLKEHSQGQPSGCLDHSVQRHTWAQPATIRNLVQGWSHAQLVPSNCGRMCTFTNEDIIALGCITTKAMNTNNVFIFTFVLISHAFLMHGYNVRRKTPNKGEQNEKWLPHPGLVRGPKEGGNAASPLHSRGFPTKGNKIRSSCLTLAFSGAQKRGKMLRHPCIRGSPNKGTKSEGTQKRGQNQKCLHHPSLLGVTHSVET